MEQLRVKSQGAYEIQVNDKGETITLNVNDTRLLGKLLNMIKDIDEKQKEFEARVEELATREDKPLEGYDGIKVPLTQNFVDYVKLLDDFCEVCRGYIDDIFGKGASLKIFGEANDPDMFERFIEELEPHLQKNKLNVKNMKKDLVQKYKNEVSSDDGVI